MRARPIVACAILASLAGAAWACSLVTSYDGFTGSAPAPCGKHPPDRPTNDSAGDVGPLVAVMKTATFLDGDAGAIGFDLDDLCTCPDQGKDKPACKSGKGGNVTCDMGGPRDGIDNAVIGLVAQFSQNPAGGTLMDDAFVHGHHGLLVALKSWNGKADDANVVVQVYNVAQVNDGGQANYDDQDIFDVAQEYLLNPTAVPPSPTYFDNKAYVVGGVLVAHFNPELRLRWVAPNVVPGQASPVDIVLGEAVISGKIRRVGDRGLAIDNATIAGRMPDVALLAAIRTTGVCGDTYVGVKQTACANVDLPSLSANDGKSSPCAAMSFGMMASFVPAKIGRALSAPLGADICDVPGDKCN